MGFYGFDRVFMSIWSVVFFGGILLFVVLLIHNLRVFFSPKYRAKLMGKEVDAVKYLVKDKMDDIAETEKIVGKAQLDVMHDIVAGSEDEIREVSDKLSDIAAPNIAKTVEAIKGAVSESKKATVFCKYCGGVIDADSRFCKHCGKEQ